MEYLEKFKDLCSKFKVYPGDRIFTRHFPDFSKLILDLTSECCNLDLLARIQLLEAGLNQPPICCICKTELANWNYKWRSWRDFTCSNLTCGHKAAYLFHKTKIEARRIQTLKENHGVDNPMKSKKIRERKNKTTFDRYGVNHTSQIPGFTEKVEATNLKRHGVRRPIQNLAILEKFKKTSNERYGKDFPISNPEIAKRLSRSITLNNSVEKRKKTNLELIGYEHALQNPIIKARLIQNSLKNWGTQHPSQAEQVKQTTRKTCLLRYGQSYFNYHSDPVRQKLESREFWQKEYFDLGKSISQICNEIGVSHSNCLGYFYSCGFEIDSTRIYPHSPAKYGLEANSLVEWLKTLAETKKEISLQSLGSSSRFILDSYISSKNLAFEYNGIYWHSEKYRNSSYHLEKTLACEKLGIRLVHVWSDDWLFKQDLMKRKIRALLGLEERKVFARKCKIIVPNQEQKRKFYQENHIKGDGAGSISYALEFEKELVAMITFKDMKEKGWDLNRFATSCSVPGGFSKLLEHFKRNHSWKKIYTFADRSWSQGNVYLKTGFKLVEEQPPTFYGVENCRRINRLSYTHEKLISRFPDLKGTQFQIMDQAGIRRIWDCGQLKFILK